MEKNYSTTISIKDSKKIGKEKYRKIKQNAQIEYDKIMIPPTSIDRYYYSTKMYLPFHLIEKKAENTAFASPKYNDEDYTAKCILVSNIVFNDDEKFIEILLNNNYHLNDIINFANFFENINLDSTENEKMKLANANVKKIQLNNLKNICCIMKQYNGICNPKLIINKIIEIFVFQKGLYTKKELLLKKQELTSKENSNKKELIKTR